MQLFYCSHPYNCNIFMQDLQVGGLRSRPPAPTWQVGGISARTPGQVAACWCIATTKAVESKKYLWSTRYRIFLVFKKMDDSDTTLLGVVAAAATVVAVVAADESRKRKRRQMWVRPMFQCRQEVGAYNMLMAELRSDDVDMYEGFIRMSPEHFDELLDLLRDDITKSSRWRMPVSAEIRLAVTLRFLATGE